MTPQETMARDVWPLLEQLYLASVDDQSKNRYAGLAENEKRGLLKEFVKQQSFRSKRWATIASNFLSASMDV